MYAYTRPSPFCTHAIKKAFLPNDWHYFLQHEHEQQQTPRTQDDIVNLKECVELLGWVVFHRSLDPKDDH